MEKNDWGQAFEIWYRDNPNLDPDDIREVCDLGSRHTLAKRIFYSGKYEFQRWLITSGFKEFVDYQNSEQDLDWDGEPNGVCDQTKALEVLKDLWKWMKRNEKGIN